MSNAEPDETRRNPRGRRLGKGFLWLVNGCVAVLTAFVLLVGALVFYLQDNPVSAPTWLRDKIEGQLAQMLPDARIRFAQMVLVMEDDWTPRLGLRDVVVRAPDGRDIVRLNEMRATFATAALLDGKIQPRRISLSGITGQIDRDAQGRVRLSAVAGGAGRGAQAANLPGLIGQIDMLLERPALAQLQSVDLRALTLRYEDARAGRAWTVDGGRLNLQRDGQTLRLTADLAVLSGGSGVATLAANYSSEIGQTEAVFGIAFDDVAAEDIAAQGPAFAWLGVLRAPISGAVRTGLREDGRFAPLAATLQIGKGAVQPTPDTPPIPFEGGESYFNYDPEDRLLRFDTLSVQSQWITADASGSAQISLDKTGRALRDLVGQFEFSAIELNPGTLYETPVGLNGVDVDFRLRLNPFEIHLGRVQIEDQEQTLSLQGAVAADPDGWRLRLDGLMDAIAPARLLALWPSRLVPRTRSWLQTNLLAGSIENINLALRVDPGAPIESYVAFDYDAATVHFAKILPPVTGAKGHFSIAENRLVITVEKGLVTPPEGGPIDAAGSSFIIPDITVKGGAPSVVRLSTQSSLPAALSLLNQPPWSVMDKANLPVDFARGQVTLAGTLSVPLKPKAQITYALDGTARAISTDVLVPGRQLTADQLAISTDNEGVTVRGAGTLGALAFSGAWEQEIGPDRGPGQVLADVTLTPEALADLGVGLPPETLTGSAPARVEIALPRGAAPDFEITSDLVGLALAVPEVSWRKAAGQSGLLQASGRLGQPAQIDRLRIEGPGLRAEGQVSLRDDGTLERLRFERAAVGEWLNVSLDLLGRGVGRPPGIRVRGGELDLRRAAFQSGGGGGGAPLDLSLNRLQITDGIALTNLRGSFTTGGGLDGQFQGLLNNAAPVTGQVVPQAGRNALRLQSADAGAVLRATGLIKQVVGGQLNLVLLPVGSGGAFDGRLRASDLRVMNAPGIAALLNAVSIVGLINELNGDGIYFDDVEATFRLTPDQLTLTEASAVGSSMGLSMDGTYALASGRLTLQGVVSPVYLLNSIGSIFTRRGEGLIGFNYTLGGTAKDPRVSVNPLSALTPAMFREIFRAPPPDLPVVDGVSESVLPAPVEAPRRPPQSQYEGR
ncbi:MAG: DUF3971 domain-containing protein [Pseudomonadota bacterium]